MDSMFARALALGHNDCSICIPSEPRLVREPTATPTTRRLAGRQDARPVLLVRMLVSTYDGGGTGLVREPRAFTDRRVGESIGRMKGAPDLRRFGLTTVISGEVEEHLPGEQG
jgi:hypothetical protein